MDGNHRGLLRRGLRFAATRVAQGARRALADGGDDLAGVGAVDVHPRTALEVEHRVQAPQTYAGVDASAGIPEDSQVAFLIRALRHASLRPVRGLRRGSGGWFSARTRRSRALTPS